MYASLINSDDRQVQGQTENGAVPVLEAVAGQGQDEEAEAYDREIVQGSEKGAEDRTVDAWQRNEAHRAHPGQG